MNREMQVLVSYTHCVMAPGESEASWDAAEGEEPNGMRANTLLKFALWQEGGDLAAGVVDREQSRLEVFFISCYESISS